MISAAGEMPSSCEATSVQNVYIGSSLLASNSKGFDRTFSWNVFLDSLSHSKIWVALPNRLSLRPEFTSSPADLLCCACSQEGRMLV